MGGKPKQPQRTKGNLKAAKSSNFSAEPLDTASLASFASISSGLLQSTLGNVLDDTSGDFDAGVHETFQLALRKMNKKDPTTKIKALREFVELVAASEESLVLASLPAFARLYVALSTDTEARVRDATQSALAAVSARAGKNLAVALKQLFPAWICAQHDTSPTAASIASAAFAKAFPPHKVADAFAFCEADTLDAFARNVTLLNAQTVGGGKQHTPEESEARYERLLISTLRGYAMYLQHIPRERVEKAREKNLSLVAHDRFWSLHRSKCAGVRSAFFEALANLLRHAPTLVCEDFEVKVVTISFKALDEADPAVLSHVWTCVLLAQREMPHWTRHIDVSKNFLPKLWRMLRSAKSPAIVFPSLLPLVSQTQLAEAELATLFESVNFGLRNEKLARGDLAAVAGAYYEVLQFTIVRISGASDLSDDEKVAKCNALIDDHVVAVIFWCINTDSGIIAKTVFAKIANVVRHWAKNSASGDVYRRVLERFWAELFEVLKGSVEGGSNLATVTGGHLELIKSLRNSASAKSVKIKASEMEAEAKVEKDTTFDDSLNVLVERLCTVYVSCIDETLDASLVETLESLVKEHQSKELFKRLAGDRDIVALYDTFAAWLQTEELRCEAVVEIILVLYKYLETSEKVDLLQRWIRIRAVQKNWLIMRALSYPLCCDAGISDFLKMPEVTRHLAECASQVTFGHYRENLIILQKCFFQAENGAILIDVNTCHEIIDIIAQATKDEAKYEQLDQCGSFLAQIFSTVCADPEKRDIQLSVFRTLLEISLDENVEHVSEDTRWEVATAWQDALSSGDIAMDAELTRACGELVREKIAKMTMASEEFERVESLALLVSKLILCASEDKQEGEKSEFVDAMMRELLQFDDKFDIYVHDLSSSGELIRGEMTLTKTSVSEFSKVKFGEAIDEYLKAKIIMLNVILMLSCNVKKKTEAEKVNDESENEDEEIEFSEMIRRASQDEEVTEDYCDLNESLLKEWSSVILERFIDVVHSEAIVGSLLTHLKTLDPKLEEWMIYMQERLRVLLVNISEPIQSEIREKMLELAADCGEFYARSLRALTHTKEYSKEGEKLALFKEAVSRASNPLHKVAIMQTFDTFIESKSMPIAGNLLEKSDDFLFKVAAARSLISNHLNVADFNETSDRSVMGHALILLNEIITANGANAFLLYNRDTSGEEPKSVLTVAAVAHLIADCLALFPSEMDVKRWDFVRIALSSWVLTVSKSAHGFRDERVRAFVVAIFRLNAALQKFIREEKTKSSTTMLTGIIDEWEHVFAKDVNLVLIKSFIHIVKSLDYESKHQEVFVDALCPHVEHIDFSYVLLAKKIDQTFSLNDLIEFALENLSSRNRGISVTAATIIRQLTRGLIKLDQEVLVQRNSEENLRANTEDDEDDMDNNKWHILESFRDTLESYEEIIKELIEDFSFKHNEMDDDAKIGAEIILPYYLLWHCILNFCAESPADLRSYYAHWISLHKYEEVFLLSLFKMMPRELVKNPEIPSKLGHSVFAPLRWIDIQECTISMERYSSFLYIESLRQIPAVVRKWWHGSSTRQAHLVERLTTAHVSPLLCGEDLATLTERKERDGRSSMHVRVLTQAREVIATYALEEARMELLIALPQNYPLGAMRVECRKHIGGQLQAREIVRQLSIYLTHQNGRLHDGIHIWRRNLDRKFEGVEECYVCYSVLHQENLQLPRLACKTCKKKFHSTCLYRWFTSSNGSTCPLCRNVF